MAQNQSNEKQNLKGKKKANSNDSAPSTADNSFGKNVYNSI